MQVVILTTAARFSLGHLMITPGALALLEKTGFNAAALIRRHVHGDWGDRGTENPAINEFSPMVCACIVSTVLWIRPSWKPRPTSNARTFPRSGSSRRPTAVSRPCCCRVSIEILFFITTEMEFGMNMTALPFRPETVFHACQLRPAVGKPGKRSKKPLLVVNVGYAVCSRSAAALLAKHHMTVDALLERHSAGDFGQVDADTARLNLQVAPAGGQTVSVFRLIDPLVLPYLDAADKRRAPAVLVLSENSRTCVFALEDV